MFRFSKCCLCVQLENGVIVIAVLSILSSILNILNITTSKDVNTGVLVTEIVIDVLIAIAAVFLIIGVNKRNSKHMFPWLVADAVRNVVYIILLITAIIDGNQPNLVGGFAISIVLGIYFWLVVFSLYRNVQEETTRSSRPNQNV